MPVVLERRKRDAPFERNAGFLKKEVSMSEQQPQAEPKKAPKRTTSKSQAAKPKAKPKLDAATAKQLQELTAEINRLESLKQDRLALMKKAHAAKAPATDIAEAAGYSVARTRQLLGK
jgi:hypothetical protein